MALCVFFLKKKNDTNSNSPSLSLFPFLDDATQLSTQLSTQPSADVNPLYIYVYSYSYERAARALSGHALLLPRICFQSLLIQTEDVKKGKKKQRLGLRSCYQYCRCRRRQLVFVLYRHRTGPNITREFI